MARVTLVVFWLFAGAMHFVKPRLYAAVVPPPLDRWKREVNYASGVAELVGAAALAAGRPRFARLWLLATLAAVYPANVWMAMRPELTPTMPRWALYARLPVQLVFAWHVWVGTAER